ncbi:MAG: putative adenylyl cyclase class-3/4/guanylyl cyclase [Solirubrobacterales bacterium]|nr:putative adenylyl cyclase class-3/4/guanylyl cyclase [Solirubrobacterales bacterium]
MADDSRSDPPALPSGPPAPAHPAPGGVRGRLLAADGSAIAVKGASRLRRALPGDASYGDALSTASELPHDLIGRELATMSPDRPSAVRELGLGALQLWQALSEGIGRGHGNSEVTILFTDIVGFSTWALAAGDSAAVALLRAAGDAQEDAVARHGGRVVKRLGDGLMAVFVTPEEAVAAAVLAQAHMAEVHVDGYRPQLRAGIHVGTPRKLGGDFLGVDVNVAARVAEAAKGGEILISDPVADHLEADGHAFAYKLGRRRRLKAAGAPRDLRVRRVQDGSD